MRASLPTEPASCENSEAENSLEGVRVFFVEDEVLVAMLMEDFLEELGCVVAASAHRVGVALQKIDQVEFDVAVLDINVGGETVTPVAEELERRSIPFIFASGYSGNALDDRFAGRPLLIKPFGQADLAAALLKALAKPAE
ncbi:response regulator [Rhodomicrobium vannielii ATCC 17100]|uniref:response regulator n=1 Tax=Rhodomicrobium vannielii TaxID=1069 RepID=UPI001918F625|nr:response regulator [Rhodomicrobium vannielii]MBJ7533707.1 response regulator [Rhodomicrobium vannielii ATCC 17100]